LRPGERAEPQPAQEFRMKNEIRSVSAAILSVLAALPW
jgi:hypothetical protein